VVRTPSNLDKHLIPQNPQWSLTRNPLAIKLQMQIRWDLLYQGQLSKLWAHAIDELHPEIALAGWQITMIFIPVFWKYVLETWSMQNQHLHNDNSHLSNSDYHQAVQTIYKTCHKVPEATQAVLFTHPIEQLLEQSPEFLCKWILQSDKYIKQQLCTTKKCAKLHTPDIRSFFGPCTPVANNLQPP